MKKKTNAAIIQIHEPCTQDFSKMHPLPGGHFCGQCERTVVDFREMSDQEIIRIYLQRKGRVCGIFKGYQLDRPLAFPQPLKEGNKWLAIAALSSTLLLSTPVGGQTAAENKVAYIANNQSVESKNQSLGILEKLVTIDGWIFGNNDEPIPFATIVLANGNGTETDFDGYFNMEIPIHLIGTEIKVSCVGYEPKSVIIHPENANNSPIEVVLKFGLTLEPVVVVYKRPPIERDYTGGGSMRMVVRKSNNIESIEIMMDKNIRISTYPNPFVSYINVELESPVAETYLFHLYNDEGQLVFAEASALEAGLQTFQLDLLQRHLPEGTYYLRISDDAGEIRTKKLVKVSP